MTWKAKAAFHGALIIAMSMAFVLFAFAQDEGREFWRITAEPHLTYLPEDMENNKEDCLEYFECQIGLIGSETTGLCAVTRVLLSLDIAGVAIITNDIDQELFRNSILFEKGNHATNRTHISMGGVIAHDDQTTYNVMQETFLPHRNHKVAHFTAVKMARDACYEGLP